MEATCSSAPSVLPRWPMMRPTLLLSTRMSCRTLPASINSRIRSPTLFLVEVSGQSPARTAVLVSMARSKVSEEGRGIRGRTQGRAENMDTPQQITGV